ncbi:MAG: TVP38/TMEM64 family protein [Eubacteriales bacterium]
MKAFREFTDTHKKIAAGMSVGIFLLFSLAVCWFVGRPMLRLAAEPEKFRLWVDGYGAWGKLLYAGMVFLQVFVALIPGEPLEIGGGYAFGAVEGTLLCLAGAYAGSLAVFLFVRRFGVKAAEIFFSPEKLRSLRFLHTSPKRDVLFFLIFSIPGTPKDLLCYFAGLTDMKLTTWLLICGVGRLASVVTSTVGGDALGSRNYVLAAVAFAGTLLVSAAGFLVYRHICTAHRDKKRDEPPKPGKRMG